MEATQIPVALALDPTRAFPACGGLGKYRAGEVAVSLRSPTVL